MYMDTTDLLTNVLSVSTSIKLLNSSAVALMVLTKLKGKGSMATSTSSGPNQPKKFCFP